MQTNQYSLLNSDQPVESKRSKKTILAAAAALTVAGLVYVSTSSAQKPAINLIAIMPSWPFDQWSTYDHMSAIEYCSKKSPNTYACLYGIYGTEG